MKKTFLLALTLQALSLHTFSQVLFSNSFGNLTLQHYSTTVSSVSYTNIPASFSIINDAYYNNAGDSTNPNKPFNVPALLNTDWATVYNPIENDTFLVSTSWIDTTGLAVDRWVITPPIPNISANTVLTWLAKSPDPTYRDGYEVYGTNKQGALGSLDFTLGDRLFFIADANTIGQGERSSWTRHSINLSNFAGQTLRFAFRNNSRDMYQVWIDDVQVVTVAQGTDAAVTDIRTEKYVSVGSSNTIKLNIENRGASDISSLVVSYQISGSNINTETPALASTLSYGQSGMLDFALPYGLTSPGLYSIKAWINSVNSSPDQNRANDTALCYITVLSSPPAKTMMIEQFLSANSGQSPDAQAYTNAIQTAPAIVVNIHDGDSLKAAGTNELISDYKKNYATALIDRFNFSADSTVIVPRPSYGNTVNQELYRLSPAAVSIINKTYTAATRQLSFTVKADFAENARGDYRLNAYLTENNVCGPYSDTTANGFNQINGFYNVTWSEFFEQGNYFSSNGEYVIDALHYKHNNTLIYSFDGAYGLPGLIPATGSTQAQSYQKTFTLTLPIAPANIHKFNPDNIYIVGFVAEYNIDKAKRMVLNASRDKLNANAEFVGIPENSAGISVSVYPNPSHNGLFYLKAAVENAYEMKVFDLFGNCLRAESGRKAGTIDLSQLPDGMYLLKLQSGKSSLAEKVIIQKN